MALILMKIPTKPSMPLLKSWQTSLLAAFLLLTLPFIVFAGNTTSTGDKRPACNLNQALDELLEVKDAKFKRPLERGSELEARVNLLKQIIFCSLGEIDSLKQLLEKLELAQEKELLLRDDLLKNLESAERYFGEQLIKLTAADNKLQDVKTLAQSVQEWRESFYKPLTAKIHDFYLVIEGNGVLETAELRLQKIQNTITIIKLNEIPRIKTLLSQSSELLKKAAGLHQEALEKMWSKISIVKQATSTEVIYQETPPATSTPETAPKTVLMLLKESLASIKTTYDNYIKISEAVKKILGL